MITAWTKNAASVEEAELLKNIILSSTTALDRLRELMAEDEAALTSTETGVKNYDLPNWEYRQADANGYRRCLKAYQKLLTFDQEEIDAARKSVRPNTVTTTPAVGPN